MSIVGADVTVRIREKHKKAMKAMYRMLTLRLVS